MKLIFLTHRKEGIVETIKGKSFATIKAENLFHTLCINLILETDCSSDVVETIKGKKVM